MGHETPVRHAEFSADGTRVVSVSYGRTSMVWDIIPPPVGLFCITVRGSVSMALIRCRDLLSF